MRLSATIIRYLALCCMASAAGRPQCFISPYFPYTPEISLKEGAGNDDKSSSTLTNSNQTNAHHHLHPALHQVKHRAQEKATMGIAQHVTENLVSKSQWWKRGIEQISALLERFHGGERLLERSGNRFAEQGAERVAERGAEGIVHRGIERSAERGTERLIERGVERITERGTERIAERGIERALESNAERIAERGIERVLEGNAERVAERGWEKLFPKRARQFAATKIERFAKSGTKRIVERNGERVAEHVLERSGERSLLRIEERFVERLLPKLGRSLSLALPALGALFGWYLFQQDLKRMSQEDKKKTKVFFGVAAVTDFVDMVLHIWIVYALWAHLSHSSLIVAEKMSLACAVGSTVSAVLGEIICSLPRHHTSNDSTSAAA